jgi:formyl-CoA transferase
MDILNPLNVPCGPILSMKELAEETSLRATGTIVEVDHPERGKYLTVGNPIKLSDSPTDVQRSPLLGEHTDEVLTEIGLSGAEIAAAKEENAV